MFTTLLCGLTLATSLIFVTPGNADHSYIPDDISLSDNTNKTIEKISDDDVRREVELIAKREKYYKKRLDEIEPSKGYYAFRCAMDEMKTESFTIFPMLKHKSEHHRTKTQLIEGINNNKEVLLPEDVKSSKKLFGNIESQLFPTEKDHLARKNIPHYFNTMFTFLTKCIEEDYGSSLSKTDREHAFKIRAELSELHGMNETLDEFTTIIVKFCSSYARTRHFSNGMHDLYTFPIQDETRDLEQEKNRPVCLAEVLGSMGLLQAWNFSEEDLNHANIIRKILKPSTKHLFLSSSYDIELLEEKNGPQVVVRRIGVLPQLDVKACPKL
ncbi:uncharacterized protein LOC135846644 [Planococcus citri]|uniref:uncharacterized protein LOC135846644 n=1 Tax=Planococcus citri TaxID=170843 RepID=UPI0031F8AA8A